MKPKRVLIASFVLIFVGLFFILNFDGNITGAAVGVPSTALSPTSSVLFGFFLIWIAGIILVGTIDEKVTIDVLKKREKQIHDWAIDQDLVSTTAHSEEIKKTGKKLSQLTDEEKAKVAGKIIEIRGKDYTDFLGVKADKYFGKQTLKYLYSEHTGVDEEYIKKLGTLSIPNLYETQQKGVANISQRLNNYVLSDIAGDKEKINALGREFSDKMGVKKDKVKDIEDVKGLYKVLKEKEKGKELDNELDKILEKYKK